MVAIDGHGVRETDDSGLLHISRAGSSHRPATFRVACLIVEACSDFAPIGYSQECNRSVTTLFPLTSLTASVLAFTLLPRHQNVTTPYTCPEPDQAGNGPPASSRHGARRVVPGPLGTNVSLNSLNCSAARSSSSVANRKWRCRHDHRGPVSGPTDAVSLQAVPWRPSPGARPLKPGTTAARGTPPGEIHPLTSLTEVYPLRPRNRPRGLGDARCRTLLLAQPCGLPSPTP